jgi:hypothetical protein
MFIEFIAFYWNVRHREEKHFLSEITVYIVSVLHLEVRNWKDEIIKAAFI